MARDFDGSANQRWFLQDVQEGVNLTEIVATDADGSAPALTVDVNDEPAVGLRSIVVSDGPAGVRGTGHRVPVTIPATDGRA